MLVAQLVALVASGGHHGGRQSTHGRAAGRLGNDDVVNCE